MLIKIMCYEKNIRPRRPILSIVPDGKRGVFYKLYMHVTHAPYCFHANDGKAISISTKSENLIRKVKST